MYIKKLHLENFRNYNTIDLNFEKKSYIITGFNGTGKTNLIESIYYLSTLKSFRKAGDENLLCWGKDYFFIRGVVEGDSEVELKLEIGAELKPVKKRVIKMNDSNIKKNMEYIGQFPCVNFLPDDINIINEGAPSRRKFLDSIFSQISEEYYNSLINYNNALKQRNRLLKEKCFTLQLYHPWNQILSENAETILTYRKDYFKLFIQLFEKYIKMISSEEDDFVIEYIWNMESIQKFKELLDSNIPKDVSRGMTSYGPHRDVVFIGKRNVDVTEFASQGQKRSSAIALKAAAYELIQEKTRNTPVLLIDDIIRELDQKRRTAFLEIVNNADQIFFTTTDTDGIDLINKDIKILNINKGMITREAGFE